MKHTFFLLGICLCFIGCDKNTDSSGTNSAQLIASADWKYDNGGIGDANGNILVDFSSTTIVPSCSFDNTIRFNSNGSGTITENANVCSGAPATSSFNWSFSSNETILNLSAGAVAGIGGSFKIKELTAAKLTLLKDTTVQLFGSVTAIVNLKH